MSKNKNFGFAVVDENGEIQRTTASLKDAIDWINSLREDDVEEYVILEYTNVYGMEPDTVFYQPKKMRLSDYQW